VDSRLTEPFFIFDDEITDYYCWLIPKDDGVEIGAALSPYRARETFEKFKRKVSDKLGITGTGELQSAIILRPESAKDFILGKNSVFLCGEAAGLISPSSAEGISYALLSGKYCAEVFNSHKKNQLSLYKKKCKPILERLKNKIDKSKVLKQKGEIGMSFAET